MRWLRPVLASLVMMACNPQATEPEIPSPGVGGAGGRGAGGVGVGGSAPATGGQLAGSGGSAGTGGAGGRPSTGGAGPTTGGAGPTTGGAGPATGGAGGGAVEVQPEAPVDLAPPPPELPPARNPLVYASTGAFAGTSLAIFELDLATGALMPRGSATTGTGPTYAAFHPNGRFMFVVNELGNKIESFSINRESGALSKLNEVPSGGTGPAHISVHRSGAFALMANFGSGHAAAMSIGTDGRLGAPIEPRQRGTGGHMAIDDGQSGKFVFVPLKNSSLLAQFRFDETTGRLTPNTPEVIAIGNPRHMAFHRSGRHAYVLTEEGANLIWLKYDPMTGLLSDPVTMPAAPSGNGAHIALHPTRELLFVCIRAYNSIATFKINADGRPEKVGETRAGLSTPWDFDIDRAGDLLLVANDGNSTVKVFRIAADGTLTSVGAGAAVNRPHFVGILPR